LLLRGLHARGAALDQARAAITPETMLVRMMARTLTPRAPDPAEKD